VIFILSLKVVWLGNIDIFLHENDDKVANTYHKGKIFGKKDPNSKRDQIAKASHKTLILSIPTIKHFNLAKASNQSDSEKKIEFLSRYVPCLRNSPRTAIEELEILFIRERHFEKGQIIKFNEFNDYIYFIYIGRCRVILPIQNEIFKKLNFDNSEEKIYGIELEIKGIIKKRKAIILENVVL